jgi:hypothetical protein
VSDVETLEARLRAMYEALDPVPEHVVDAAIGAYAWRTIDADLAELAGDSALAASSVRGADAARLITFEAPGLTLEIEIAQVGERRRILGQLVPPTTAEIRVEGPAGSVAVTADERGRFAAADVPAGLTRLVVDRAGTEVTVTTRWIAI